MRVFNTIAMNAFMELIRQPIYLVLMVGSGAFMLFLASLYYVGTGEDASMVKSGVLASLFLIGLFVAVLGASLSVGEEVETGTALAVLSKPVGRVQFVLAKFTGLAGAPMLQCYTGCLAALLASRMAFDVYGSPDYPAIFIFGGALLLAGLIGAGINFFMMRPFVGPTVLAAVVCTTVAFVIVNYVDKNWQFQNQFGEQIDWRMIKAVGLLLMALWALAGIAITCSTRMALIPTLVICMGIFLTGLVSDHFFGQRAEDGVLWAKALYALIPNWQLFWMADALAEGKSIPWSYLLQSMYYVIGSLVMSLGLAVWLFDERELS